MPDEIFMVTGSFGCIGAWVLRTLVDEGTAVVATDLAGDPVRPRLLLSAAEMARIDFQVLDVTDREAVQTLVAAKGITHIVHLAGLQVPFCRANPTLGAMVNVVGTVNLFEAAQAHRDQVRGFTYASSLAVMGPPTLYADLPVPDDARLRPDTLYGVYKQANEQTARVYWLEHGIPSIGLRPYIVYGVARDQGMTSDIAKAILAAVADRPYHLKFNGFVALQLAADVARTFIACARSGFRSATACNLRNDVVTVPDFVAEVRHQFPQARLTHPANKPLPYPHDLSDEGLRRIITAVPHTPLAEGIAATAERYRDLLRRNRLDLSQLAA